MYQLVVAAQWLSIITYIVVIIASIMIVYLLKQILTELKQSKKEK